MSSSPNAQHPIASTSTSDHDDQVKPVSNTPQRGESLSNETQPKLSDHSGGRIKQHGLPLRFSNLSVVQRGGSGGREALIQTLGSSLLDVVTGGPIARLIAHPLGLSAKNEKLAIVGVDGLVHQGEMLLIVGPPKSNASLLLRALSSPSDLKLTSNSLLDYGLLSPPLLAQTSLFATTSSVKPVQSQTTSIRSEVVYVSGHDVHFATLSLENSLLPGALAKSPRNRGKKVTTRKEWATARLTTFVDALGLGHALGTKVGSPIVRGLSGGERKRASIIEALLTRASCLLLEGPTNGLDSSTALSVLTYLKDWTTKGKRSLVATSPHISDPLYAKFDKVLVLSSNGRQVYFGPVREAEQYFERLRLGFKRRVELGEGTAEFLVGCIEGRANDRELEMAWAASDERKLLLQELLQYEAKYPPEECALPLLTALAEEKSQWTSKSSHYTISFLNQVQILTRRQYSLIRSELPTYITKTVVNVLLSILVGTLFFQLPTTTSAAFTRGSALLLSIMFNAYLSLAELGKAIEGRDIVKRQRDWGFFGASAVALARLMGDLPLIGAQVLLFGTITYFLAGLQRTVENFAIYILFVYATALTLSAMFRMFASFSPGFEQAIRYCGITLNILVVYAGYFIPTPSMRPWLKWIHYVIDPISYAYEAVLANEFHNLNLTCSPHDIVPSGFPQYNDPRFQTCLLAGSKPKSLIVSGDDYLAVSYDFHHDKIWRNLGIMAIQAIVFTLIGVIATDYLHFAPEGTKRIWARTRRVKKRLGRKWYLKKDNDQENGIEGRTDGEDIDVEDLGVDDEFANGELNSERNSLAEFESDTDADGRIEVQGDDTLVTEGSTLAWQNVSLWVDTPMDTRRLLDRISGYIKPGKICALMGASGAGKSTLLNVLAGRKVGVVKGTIIVDGQHPSDQFYRTTGYVEQFDLHDDKSTVREALEFSAILRQDAKLTRSEKLAYVNVVLDLLDLTSLQDAIIGTPSAGLNLEQRKRVTIAVEVVSKPAILFCDEPTTGLDTKSALKVVKLLRRLARAGLAVIATIHQPSAETFAIFDDLLLLQRGGKQVYFGPRVEALNFFSSEEIGKNPADVLLEATGAGVDVPDDELAEVDNLNVLADRWKSSDASKRLVKDLSPLISVDLSKKRQPSSSASILQQCIELTGRVSRHYYRDISYSYTKLFTVTVVSLIVGLSFLQQGNTIVSLQNRLFSTFLLLFVPAVWMNVSIFMIFKLRGLWEARERPSKIYGRTAFVTSLIISEIPYSVVCASIYFVFWYFLVGLPGSLSAMSYTFAMVQIFFIFQSTWALWITALAPTLGAVAQLLPFFLVSMEAFNGSLMPYSEMPGYWRWLYWVSPFQWYIRGVLGVILHDLPVICGAEELVRFDSPPGLSCAEFAAQYLTSHAGYLVYPTSQSVCEFCKMSVGDDYLSVLNIQWTDRWLSMGILAMYTITNIILVYGFTFFPPRLPNPSWFTGHPGNRERAEVIAEETLARETAESVGAETLAGGPRTGGFA